jgi:hypothetical protein
MLPALAVLLLSGSVPLADFPITFYGIGPIKVGASLADGSLAAGEQLVEATDKPSGADGCYHVRLQSSPNVLFMVEEERITRLETADPRFRTKSGVRVGDSEADAHGAYGKRLEVREHKYLDTGHYLIVRSADDEHALLMETDGKTIMYIRAGVWPSVGYWEGCN